MKYAIHFVSIDPSALFPNESWTAVNIYSPRLNDEHFSFWPLVNNISELHK